MKSSDYRQDYKGAALTLGGTNYGESDKILQLLLEDGRQIGVLAKGLRRGKSKLAGGVQILAVNYVEIHFSSSGKLPVLTGAKMREFFAGILGDYGRLGKAYAYMKRMKKVWNVENGRFFEIMQQTLRGLDDREMPMELTEGWFLVNLGLLLGDINDLYYATDGKKLEAGRTYSWDGDEKGFFASEGSSVKQGKMSSEEIKFLRFLAENDLRRAKNVRNWHEMLEKIINCGMIKL